MALLCVCVSAAGQKLKPLNIGDTLPDMVLHHVLNYKDSVVSLSDFKDKLLILDFWATWCGSCLKGMPKMDSLQTEFKNNLQVLFINPKISGDSSAKIKATVQRIESGLHKKLSVPVIMYDTAATAHFKFRLVPHYVWIKNGVVIAITHKAQVTEANIRAIINGQKISLPVKNDYLQQ